MLEAVVTLAVVCALQSIVVSALMVALVRFIDQRGRVEELRRDVDDLDRMVDPMFDEFKKQ